MSNKRTRDLGSYGLRRKITLKKYGDEFELYSLKSKATAKTEPKHDPENSVHHKRGRRPRESRCTLFEVKCVKCKKVMQQTSKGPVDDSPHICDSCIGKSTSKCDLKVKQTERHSVEHATKQVGNKECKSDSDEASSISNDLLKISASGKIECSECHKQLKPNSYKQHLKTHTGVRPFTCDVCNAHFTRKGDVERHIKIVHYKEKPFKCCRCQRAFGDKKNLRWHLMNHDKRLFYVCDVCGFKFGKKEYWENHVRFIHPNQKDSETSSEKPELDSANSAIAIVAEAASQHAAQSNEVVGTQEEVFQVAVLTETGEVVPAIEPFVLQQNDGDSYETVLVIQTTENENISIPDMHSEQFIQIAEGSLENEILSLE